MKPAQRKAPTDSLGVHGTKTDTVGVRDLKASLSGYLRRVRDGRSLTVTDHGEPIALIIPIGIPAGLERLLSAGRASWGGAASGPGMPQARLRGVKTASQHVVEDRDASEHQLDRDFRRKAGVAGKS